MSNDIPFRAGVQFQCGCIATSDRLIKTCEPHAIVLQDEQLKQSIRLLTRAETAEAQLRGSEERNRILFDGKNAVIAELQKQKDGAYAERNLVVALAAKLCVLYMRSIAAVPSSTVTLNGFGAWRGKHVDIPGQEWDDDWRNVIYMMINGAQLSWHIHDTDLPTFDWLDEMSPDAPWTWDGHTTDEKYERLRRFVLGG